MSIAYNPVVFCSTKDFESIGFSRNKSKDLMKQLTRDYKKAGYIVLGERAKIPMTFANQWAIKRICCTITKGAGEEYREQIESTYIED